MQIIYFNVENVQLSVENGYEVSMKWEMCCWMLVCPVALHSLAHSGDAETFSL
jgi:hypothetical protein